MGASNWIYYVPYQENIEQALQCLRQQVFASGDYYHSWRLHVYDQVYDEQGEPVPEGSDEAVPNPLPPQTIEELLQRSQPEGTHSILDIHHVADEAQLRAACPLSEPEYVQLLSASRPTREDLEFFFSHAWLGPSIIPLIEGNLHLQRERMKNNLHFHPHPFPREVLLYFEKQWTKEELIEAFLSRTDLWEPIHRYACDHTEKRIWYAKLGKAFPFPQEVVLQYLGTEKPTGERAREVFAQEEIWGHLARHIARYIILYRNDEPAEIVFAGFSGD